MNKLLPSSVEHFGIVLNGGARSVITSKLSACNQYVVLIDENRAVIVCHLSTGYSWTVPIRARACAIALNADNEFAVASENGLIQRFDITLPTICLGKFEVGAVNSMSYDPSGTMLTVARTDGRVNIFDLEHRPGPGKIASLQVTDRAIPLLSARKDTIIGVDKRGRLFCVRNPECEPEVIWNGADHLDWDCYTLATHPFLTRIVVAGFGPYLRFYSAHSAKPSILVSSFTYIRELAFLVNTNQLSVVGDRGLEVWDLGTQSVDFVWRSPQGKVLCAQQNESKLNVIWS